MIEFGVNLKRFEVPLSLGGICTEEDTFGWLERILKESVELGLGSIPGFRLRLFFPEALAARAVEILEGFDEDQRGTLSAGCQTVYRNDIVRGGNFGAFTANLPGAAVKNLGIKTALVGHSEERADKFDILLSYDPDIGSSPEKASRANHTVNLLIGREVLAAEKAGLSVMLCVGETAEEKGAGTPEEQAENTRVVLKDQLDSALKEASCADTVIAYEPRWAIGPGKTPPGPEYIRMVSEFIKEETREICGKKLAVLYGGGLKRENAASVAGVAENDGGLVALTKFTDPIGFDPRELKIIVDMYLRKKGVLQ